MSFIPVPCSPEGPGGGGGLTEPVDVNIIGSGPLDVNVLNPSDTTDDECLQDDNGVFFRRTHDDGAGNITVSTVDLAGNPYVPVGTITGCAGTEGVVTPDRFVFDQILCDSQVPFLRKYVQSAPGGVGQIDSFTDTDFSGNPYVPVGQLRVCGQNEFSIRLCDDDGNQPPFPFLRVYHVNSLGQVTSFNDITLNGSPYAATGTVVQCEAQIQQEILCDVGAGNTKFIRTYQYNEVTGAFIDRDDYDLNGVPYVVVGPTAICPQAGHDIEVEVLCDDNGPFLRSYDYDMEDGQIIGITDTLLDGATPYVPVGTITTCGGEVPPAATIPVVLPEVVCYEISPGVQGQLAVVLCDGCTDLTPQYFDIGTGIEIINPVLVVCEPATVRTPIVLGELCASAPDPNAPPLSFSSGFGTADFVEGPDNTFTAVNYQGSGVTVTLVVDPALGAAMISPTHVQLNGGGNFPLSVSFSQPVTVRGISFGEMDASFAAETFSDYSIPPTGVTGALTLGPGPTYFTNTTINDGNPDGEVQFNTLTNNFTFNYQGNGLGTWIQGLRFEMPNPATIDQTVIAVKCDGCDGGVAYFNKESGLEVLNPTIVDCPAEAVTLDEPIDVNVLNFPASVEVSNDIGNPLPVSGTVAVSNFPASVEVSNDVGNPLPVTTAAQTAASTIQRQTGAGNIVIPAGRKSVTFVSIAGAPTLQVGAGTPVAVPAGATLTFAVDDRNQTLSDTFTGTAGAADDFIIITTA